jgi:hypothetical protein
MNLSDLVSGKARVMGLSLRGGDAFCQAFHGAEIQAGEQAGRQPSVGCWLSLFE